MESSHISLPLLGTEVVHRFNPSWCSPSVELSNNNATASRGRNINNAIVLASTPMWQATEDDIFEIRIDEVQKHWSGSLRIGVVTQAPNDSFVKDLKSLPGNFNFLN